MHIVDPQLEPFKPFLQFTPPIRSYSALRAAIHAAYRRPEPDCLEPLLAAATLASAEREQTCTLARRLVEALRARRSIGLIERLIQEYSLSTQEGIALMCLAEALLRIPDNATRDALIADKIGGGDWRSHLGSNRSLFINAATWGLIVAGKLTGASADTGLAAALTRVIARSGEPIIRRAIDISMRMMGEQFVSGQTITEALHRGREAEANGFRHSYDMLGEAAITSADADRYYQAYKAAIDAIGRASNGRGIQGGPGISIKLSALHPRYSRAQYSRVMNELYPRLRRLVALARGYDIGINIDAEEAERLDLSLDLLAVLCREPELACWNGIGFVVQAYQRRAPYVLDYIIGLARSSRRRLMVRLVKGAYWDSEIKRAQVDGQVDFPVFTRKTHTDVSYIACARKLLAAPDAVYPQFATHNALTLATIHTLAGPDWWPGQYEFQCLHGMGEPLYEQVVGPAKLDRPCRIYSPVGTHQTLLAYLVRRLLENGANSSFVNRIADPVVPIDALLEDPVEAVRAAAPAGTRPGAQHSKIRQPRDLYQPSRLNSAGLDLSDETVLAKLAHALPAAMPASDPDAAGEPICNPADHRDRVGTVTIAGEAQIDSAFLQAEAAFAGWASTEPTERAVILDRAAELLERDRVRLINLACREAGKTVSNAVGEVREAVDFLRYYAAQSRAQFVAATHKPLGIVLCISPWNFPLAIFLGQASAALAAGNVVLAKPAEETPLIAAAAVELLHEAGVPAAALQLIVGAGGVGARLVADSRTAAVVFTGSTEVARAIQRTLATRLDADGRPVPLIAETGGMNALIADSSALTEQLVGDILTSAFDSAGQRCSALRILCLQDESADTVLEMLTAALAELEVGDPCRLATDIGPVITAEAQASIAGHIERMRRAGCIVHARPLPPEAGFGTFIAPTIIELDRLDKLDREVFGPVLHVIRYRRDELPDLVEALNRLGYALTFGVHSRIDQTIADVSGRIEAGNLYVNRNIVGAVVGVQPFGGHGLSGTGPKAGGPLYLRRLLASAPEWRPAGGSAPGIAAAFCDWLSAAGQPALAEQCGRLIERSGFGGEIALPGPVGESNHYWLAARGAVLCHAEAYEALVRQVAAVLATGNRALLAGGAAAALLAELPARFDHVIARHTEVDPIAVALYQGGRAGLLALQQQLAARPGPIVLVFGRADNLNAEPMEWLLEERVVTINTAAAGGNTSLMTIDS